METLDDELRNFVEQIGEQIVEAMENYNPDARSDSNHGKAVYETRFHFYSETKSSLELQGMKISVFPNWKGYQICGYTITITPLGQENNPEVSEKLKRFADHLAEHVARRGYGLLNSRNGLTNMMNIITVVVLGEEIYQTHVHIGYHDYHSRSE